MLAEKGPKQSVIYDHWKAENIFIPDSDLRVALDVFHSNRTSYPAH